MQHHTETALGRVLAACDAAYMTPKEAADYVRSSPSTLAKRRITGQLPNFSRIGKAIRYRRSDLDTWMNGNVRKSTSETASAHVAAAA